MHKITTWVKQKEINKAKDDLSIIPTDMKEEHIEILKKNETDLLCIEFKKMFLHILIEQRKKVFWFDWLDTAWKTTSSAKLKSPSTMYNEGLISRVSLSVPTKKESKLPITNLYEKHFPGKWKTIIQDRSFLNRAFVQYVYWYCSQEEYDTFMETLESELNRFQENWFELENYFLHITKKTQEARLNLRKIDPERNFRYSESDKKALKMYDKIVVEVWKVAKIFKKAWVPFNLIDTNDLDKWFINLLKTILVDADYPKKSKKIDFTPDSRMVKTSVEDILKFTWAWKIKV